MGRLRARGMLELSQFWPEGSADADTANLIISLDLSPSFVFRPDSGVETPTKVFDQAYSNDEGQLKPVLGRTGSKLKVRLQGIDAPELHYLPRVRGARNFRQRLAESAVFALRNKLLVMADGAKSLRADAITFVDQPNDVFDMYGRYVGNITVYADGFALDINHWLLEHGWAVPGLYNSMTQREIDVARALSQAAAAENLGLYKSNYYKEKLIAFEYDLVVRHRVDPNSFTLYDDKGPLINPKFFRRQSLYEAKERNRPSGRSFRESLVADPNYRALTYDKFSTLPESLRKDLDKLRPHTVSLGSLISEAGRLPSADDLVYLEGEAGITNAQGQAIDRWDFAQVNRPPKKAAKRAAKKKGVKKKVVRKAAKR